jgi:hypothetical protein
VAIELGQIFQHLAVSVVDTADHPRRGSNVTVDDLLYGQELPFSSLARAVRSTCWSVSAGQT